jgi:hypothetical protein
MMNPPTRYARLLIADGDVIVVATGNRQNNSSHTLQGYDAGSGRQLWTSYIASEGLKAVRYGQDSGVVASSVGVVGTNLRDGAVLWRRTFTNMLSSVQLREQATNAVEVDADGYGMSAGRDTAGVLGHYAVMRTSVSRLMCINNQIVVGLTTTLSAADLELKRECAWVILSASDGRLVNSGSGEVYAASSGTYFFCRRDADRTTFWSVTSSTPPVSNAVMNVFAYRMSRRCYVHDELLVLCPKMMWPGLLDFGGRRFILHGPVPVMPELKVPWDASTGRADYSVVVSDGVVFLYERTNASWNVPESGLPIHAAALDARMQPTWVVDLLACKLPVDTPEKVYVDVVGNEGGLLWFLVRTSAEDPPNPGRQVGLVGVSIATGKTLKMLPIAANIVTAAGAIVYDQRMFCIALGNDEESLNQQTYQLKSVSLYGDSARAWAVPLKM